MCRSLTTLAMLILMATTLSHAQGLGGLLNKAKAKVNQATNTSPAPAWATQDNNGPIPESPPVNGLTVENQQAFARSVLDNHRPWVVGEGTHDDDYFYRYLRQEYKVPVKFTWDQPFVAYITPKSRYLWSIIEDMCEAIFAKCDPAESRNRYFLANMSKVREIHLTTIYRPLRESDPGYDTGYLLSFDPATGILSAAAATAGTRGISNFGLVDNDLARFIQEKIK